MLDQFAPPYVVVDGEGDIVLYSSRTGKYLEAAAGAPTRQILAIARKGLRLDLRTSLRDAMESGQPVMREGIAVEGEEGRVQMITLTVAPVADRHGDNPLFLVLFADQGQTLSREEAAQSRDFAQGRCGASARTRTARNPRTTAILDRGIRNRAGRAEIVERRAGISQRRTAIDQRRTGGLQRRTAVRQRRTAYVNSDLSIQNRALDQAKATCKTCLKAPISPRCSSTQISGYPQLYACSHACVQYPSKRSRPSAH